MTNDSKTRKLKVYGRSGYNFKTVPGTILQGNWLKEAGFDVDTPITVTCENGKLVIEPREREVIGERITTIVKGGNSYVAERQLIYG